MTESRRSMAGAAAMVLVGALSACALLDPAPALPPDARGLTPFGTALLEALATEAEGNVAVAPINLAVALDALADVASPNAQRRIRTMLWGGADEAEGQQDTLADLARAFQSGSGSADPAVHLNAPVALFADRATALDPAAVTRLRQRYGAAVETLAFAEPEAAGRINTWVADATDGGIPELVDQLPNGTAFVLASALYFKGEWATAFDPARTADRPFTTGDSRTVSVPAMQADFDRVACRTAMDWQAVRLPYGRGDYQAVVLVPAVGLGGSAALRTALTHAADVLEPEGYVRRPGTVSLPRFTVTGQAEMKPVLDALGLDGAFDTPAAFAGFASPSSSVSQIRHKVRIAVDEAGTVASAATAVLAVRSLPIPDERCDIDVNRPFLFAVQHVQSGAVLFLAWVADPGTGEP